MGVQAYILIQSEIGSSEAVVLATRAVPGVLESFEVTVLRRDCALPSR